ncbi:PLDc N-terminal domain-containing protein [Streptococcus halichoeri]|uniref:PLDc N-terminal domain-containing protein n=1 Tax=Streptococcus halichoeri TaxID=254785 RepID=UPI0039A5BE85
MIHTKIPSHLLPLLLPLFALQLILIVIALLKLKRLPQTTHLNKPTWVLVICLGNILGPIIFFILEGKRQ